MRNNFNSYHENSKIVKLQGPKESPDRKHFGYYRTGAELRAWYGKEGFNVVSRNRGWLNQILTWIFLDFPEAD